MDSSTSTNASLPIHSPPPASPLPFNSPPPPPPPPPPRHRPINSPPPPPSSQSSHPSRKQKLRSRPLQIGGTSNVRSLSSVANAARRCSQLYKPKIRFINWHRAFNCEIVLSKIKIPVPQFVNAILSMDSSALGIEQVEDLLRFFPNVVEMDALKKYSGDKRKLGKCEQFFLDLMKVPRMESKLRVFLFIVTYTSQVTNIKLELNIINAAAKEIKESVKLRQLIRTIVALGVPLNRGSARASRPTRLLTLDSLLGRPGTPERNNKTALLHHLRKVIVQKKPELLDFSKDLVHLEQASKIRLSSLANETYAVYKGIERVNRELISAENDGAVFSRFRKVLKSFFDTAESELTGFGSLYTQVGRIVDSLTVHFLDDPARYPFEKVIETFVVFTKMLTDDEKTSSRRTVRRDAIQNQTRQDI
ncbi:hypothetical protein ABFS83_09G010500 [Erythranthe nasuta]